MLIETTLRDLLGLLREFGVTKYTTGDLTLEIAQTGSFQVINHEGKAVDGPSEPVSRPASVDPALKAMFDKLPPGYQQAFELGS